MSQKKPKCDRSKFASQADYEACLEDVRVGRLDDGLSMDWPEVREDRDEDDDD